MASCMTQELISPPGCAMTIEEALQADSKQYLEEAAATYEQVLAGESDNMTALLNLIVLYWRVTEFGFWTGMKLPPSFVRRSGVRLTDLLNVAAEQYPDNIQFRFWEMYISWIEYGSSFDIDACRQMLKNNPDYYEPVIALVQLSERKEGYNIAILLRECCANETNMTTRMRYVCSVVNAALNRWGK